MRWIISIPLLLLLCGCADFGYYWHNASGHLAIMKQRVDIEDMLADDQLELGLRERLLLVQQIRQFSIDRLDLPANDSYDSYVQLEHPYVIQNIFAAPEFSTRLYQWCYPLIGCASYRGYHDEERMLAYVDKLKADGLEVHIGKVPAYSTLGWFDDPVLSSFINWPDYRLAGLLFHELTHQQIYIDDDTSFNESLASAVQQVGTELWLKANKREAQLSELSRWLRYRDEVIKLIESIRTELTVIYAGAVDDVVKREQKSRVFDEARLAHADIAAKYGIQGGYTHWFAQELNNAKIGSIAAYNSLAPAFVNMIHAHNLDFSAFYDYVDNLGSLAKIERDRCLQAWTEKTQLKANDCPPDEGLDTTAF
ncbi:MAG: aminopeptidase [Gammaproteobacteria bacterium]|nr:aminopeptidase [Gammaproteobacteria bacterium]